MLKTNISFDGEQKVVVFTTPKVRHLAAIADVFRDAQIVNNIVALATFVELLAIEFDGNVRTSNDHRVLTSEQFMDADASSLKGVAELLSPFLSQIG